MRAVPRHSESSTLCPLPRLYKVVCIKSSAHCTPPHSQSEPVRDAEMQKLLSVTIMRKTIIASVLITGVIISIILIWKFYPRPDVVDIHKPSEVIEEDSLVSLFAGSSLVKGGSSTFFIIGLLGLAFYYIRRKKLKNSSLTPSSPPCLPWTPAPPAPSRWRPTPTTLCPRSTLATWAAREQFASIRWTCRCPQQLQVRLVPCHMTKLELFWQRPLAKVKCDRWTASIVM